MVETAGCGFQPCLPKSVSEQPRIVTGVCRKDNLATEISYVLLVCANVCVRPAQSAGGIRRKSSANLRPKSNNTQPHPHTRLQYIHLRALGVVTVDSLQDVAPLPFRCHKSVCEICLSSFA